MFLMFYKIKNKLLSFIDIVGEIPVVLTTGGIALTCKLVRACFFTLASSLVYFTNYLCYNS